MSNIWIMADFQANHDGIAKERRVRSLIESKARTLKESSEEGRVSLSYVRCECGETLPWKILADGESDLTEFAKGLDAEIGEILDHGTFSVTVDPPDNLEVLLPE